VPHDGGGEEHDTAPHQDHGASLEHGHETTSHEVLTEEFPVSQ